MWKSKNSIHIINYISTLMVYFLRMLVPFLIIVLIGRLYSPEEFGRYAVATSFMSVLGLFLTFGITNVASYEIAAVKKTDKKFRIIIAEILNTCLIILLLFSSIGLLLMGIILLFFDYSPAIIKIIFALFFGYLFMAFNSVLSAVFIGIKEMKWIIPSTIANLISVVIVVLPFIFMKKPIHFIALLWSISQFTGIIVNLFLLKTKNLLLYPKLNKAEIPRLIKRSIGVGLDNIIYKLGVNLTNIILPFFLSEKQIGVFNGAFKPFVLLVAGNQITIQFFIPYIASKINEEKKDKEKIIHVFHKINIFFTCLIIILPFFFSDYLNRFFFGNKLLESIPYMMLLSLGYFVYYLPPYSTPLKAFGKEWKVLCASFAQLVINFAAILVLVPKYGVNGAVYAVMLAFFGYWFVNILLYLNEKIRPVSDILNYVIFILIIFVNGFFIIEIFNQNIFSIVLFQAINLFIAYAVLLSKVERKTIMSYVNVRKTFPFIHIQ